MKSLKSIYLIWNLYELSFEFKLYKVINIKIEDLFEFYGQ